MGDLRGATLRARKEALRLLLAELPPGPIRYCDHVQGQGKAFFEQACRAGLEGIVSKGTDAPYRPGRSKSWLKTKCGLRQEAVIVGYTDPGGSRMGFGALLLGVHDNGDLRYAGKVGTGFDRRTLRELLERLEPLVRSTPPIARPRGVGKVHWVEPELVAAVAFSEWTRDGRMRHPRYLGLREDKAPPDVKVEKPSNGRSGGPIEIAGVRLTHPDKVMFPENGVTKRALAEYYEQVAEVMLPELRLRPLTLVRCPEGRHKHCFYQKHINASVPDIVPRVPVKPGEYYAMVDDVPAVIGLCQIGVLEIHAWGARADRLDRPDRLVIDLDPGPDVPWSQVVVTAQTLRQRLDDLGLNSFARITGGKGLHVVVPITRHTTWEGAKEFTHALALELVRHAPEHFTAKMTKSLRRGKIFVDYLRNDRESTAIASYSVRAREGAPVALPIAWDELDERKRHPPRFDMAEARRRVAAGIDPWADIAAAARRLTAQMRRKPG